MYDTPSKTATELNLMQQRPSPISERETVDNWQFGNPVRWIFKLTQFSSQPPPFVPDNSIATLYGFHAIAKELVKS